MNRSRRELLRAASALGVVLAAGGASAQARGQAYKTVGWDDLIPADWDPLAVLKAADLDPGKIGEGSAAELEASRKLREIWDAAPARADLQGARIRLPGYVVPLEMSQGSIREFLLVPYFGACIHVPPPPANQIVLVRLDKPAALQTMDAVWVWGELGVQRSRTEWGLSGYSLAAKGTSAYRDKPTR